MKICNGLVFSEKGKFENKDLYTKNGLVVSEAQGADGEVIDAEGLYVVPGFVDVHTHGSVGHDFCDGDKQGLAEIAAFQYRSGITSFCPTSMTLSEERLQKIFAAVAEGTLAEGQARIAGIHMEGPFIAPSKKGAQNGEFIFAPDVEMFRRLKKSSGDKIAIVTIAPETPGAMEFIKELAGEVTISLGHTATDYDTAMEAFANGANHVTHTCNAMPPLSHREPGLIGAAADSEDVYAEVICDGIHIHGSMIRRIVDMFGEDRVVLISDSMEATGMPDGEYELGGQKVFKTDRTAVLADGVLAGSASNLFDCFKKVLSFGIPAEAALKMATINPAKSIGMAEKIGTLKEGAYADILLLDKDFNLVKVLRG